MPSDVFQIYFSESAENLLSRLDADIAKQLRDALAERAKELQKIALDCTHAAVPIRTRELQADIVAEETPGNWRVVIQGTQHLNGAPINSIDLAFTLDENDEFRRNFTNPGTGEISTGSAGAGNPTAGWIDLAHSLFSEMTGY